MTTKPTWHNFTVEETLQTLNSSIKGLSQSDAEHIFAAHGANKLPHVPPPNPIIVFFHQFINPIIYVLFLVAITTLFLHHYLDTIIILSIIIINSLIGFLQEIKAEYSVEKLENYFSLRCKVLRDGEPHEINADLLVPGDIVFIEQGTKIPADMRLIENIDLRVDESVLTGESIPAAKRTAPITGNVPLGDRRNILYSGTFATSGRGRGVVVATGSQTEFGKIAESLVETNPPTSPLQIQLATLTKQLITIIAFTMGVIIVIGLLRRLDPVNIFLTGINLAVSAIPEGLPAILTITLAIGVRRMAKQKAIIRYLPAVETLGSVTLVATDKTGTLTRDEMVIEKIYLAQGEITVTGDGYIPEGRFHYKNKPINPLHQPDIKLLLTAGTICNDTSLVQEDNTWKIVGDPTEGAIVVTAAKGKLAKPNLEERFQRLDEIPFHTAKRFMATLHKDKQDGQIIALKGAAEKIFTLCKYYSQGGHHYLLNKKIREEFTQANRQLAAAGYRVLAVAYKPVKNMEKINEKDLSDSILLGLCAMSDAPRPEAHHAINLANKADIRVVMLTGDHALTAQSVARSLDITAQSSAANPHNVITGTELDDMPSHQINQLIQHNNIFARISPLNKLSLVKNFQKHGHLVAVTGDGINDAPALKQADIGIAMGKTGTDVSREAADMILANDNFATIISAIEEGRTIYQNIKRVILYLLSTNVGEIMVILTTLVLGLPLPLQPVQILWLNLLTDGAGTIPLALEPKHSNIMRFPPRSPSAPLIDNIMRWRILLVSSVMTIGTVSLFYWELRHNGFADARTVAFEIMVLFQIMNIFNCRSLKESVFSLAPFNNLYVVAAFITAWILTIFAIYLPPLQRIFYTTPLDLSQWLRIIFISLSVIIVVEIEKWYRREHGSQY